MLITPDAGEGRSLARTVHVEMRSLAFYRSRTRRAYSPLVVSHIITHVNVRRLTLERHHTFRIFPRAHLKLDFLQECRTGTE